MSNVVSPAIRVQVGEVARFLAEDAPEEGVDMTLDDCSGETIAEQVCDLIVRADDEGCFAATDLMGPTITINAYSVDLDAVVITIRPRSTWLGPAIWAYAQVASYATEMRDLGAWREVRSGGAAERSTPWKAKPRPGSAVTSRTRPSL